MRAPGFRRLFISQTLSRWGSTFTSVAVVVAVLRLSGSGLDVAGVVGFEVAPVLVLGLFAGAVVDRVSRKAVMVTADLGRAGLLGLLAAFPRHVWVLYAVAAGSSMLGVFFNPAASSSVPTLVGTEDLVGANSALWSAAVLSQVALAPAAGGLVALAGPAPAFGIDSCSFAISAAMLSGLGLPRRPPPVRVSLLTELAGGLAVIRSSRLLTTLALAQGLAALSAGATSALLVVLASRHLQVGAGGFGLLLGAIGVGAAVGPIVLQRVVTEVRRPRFIFGPYLLRGLVDLVLAATSSFGVALAALAAYGVGTSTGNVAYQSTLQSRVPDGSRGRVFAAYDVIWACGRLVSIGAGGALADAVGIASVYALGGALLLVAGLLGLARGWPPASERACGGSLCAGWPPCDDRSPGCSG
ncbi:MAG: MFS transporter [Acidimicrobiales bacterium]